jgi:flagellar biosynthesis/type III secretory pathway protein FliH
MHIHRPYKDVRAEVASRLNGLDEGSFLALPVKLLNELLDTFDEQSEEAYDEGYDEGRNTSDEDEAYRDGYQDGLNAARRALESLG